MGSDPDADSDRNWVTIALLAGTRGNKGELWAIPLSSHPERYRELKEVFLFGPEGGLSGSSFVLESAWEYRGRLVLKFKGIDSISDAERLDRAEVRIPVEQRAQAPAGEFYYSDLVGCEVVDRKSGESVGKVARIEEIGGGVLLNVESRESGKEILIPFAKSICVEIDVQTRRIVAELPEGLKELNS